MAQSPCHQSQVLLDVLVWLRCPPLWLGRGCFLLAGGWGWPAGYLAERLTCDCCTCAGGLGCPWPCWLGSLAGLLQAHCCAGAAPRVGAAGGGTGASRAAHWVWQAAPTIVTLCLLKLFQQLCLSPESACAPPFTSVLSSHFIMLRIWSLSPQATAGINRKCVNHFNLQSFDRTPENKDDFLSIIFPGCLGPYVVKSNFVINKNLTFEWICSMINVRGTLFVFLVKNPFIGTVQIASSLRKSGLLGIWQRGIRHMMDTV